MVVRLALTAFLVCGLLACVSPLFAVEAGASKDDVIAELGRPTSQVARGNREILSYPKTVRIELVDGQVQSAEGISLTFREEEAGAKSKGTAPKWREGKALEPENARDENPSRAERKSIHSEAKPHVDPVAALDRLAHQAEAESDQSGRAVNHPTLAALAFLLGFHFIVTLIALKLAFKFWSMDALATGVLMIALIDVSLHGVFATLGPLTNGLTTMPAVENGIPGIVMILSIRHFCFNKNLTDAIQTAAVVKVVVLLLKTFGVMAVLSNAFH